MSENQVKCRVCGKDTTAGGYTYGCCDACTKRAVNCHAELLRLANLFLAYIHNPQALDVEGIEDDLGAAIAKATEGNEKGRQPPAGG